VLLSLGAYTYVEYCESVLCSTVVYLAKHFSAEGSSGIRGASVVKEHSCKNALVISKSALGHSLTLLMPERSRKK